MWIAKADLLAKRQSKKSTKQPTSWYQCGYKGCEKVVTRTSQHLYQFHRIDDEDILAKAKKTFVRISGPQKKSITSSSDKSSVSIKKPFTASVSKLPLQFPSIKKKSSSPSTASGSKRLLQSPSIKSKSALFPSKRPRYLTRARMKRHTSTTTVESDYSFMITPLRTTLQQRMKTWRSYRRPRGTGRSTTA